MERGYEGEKANGRERSLIRWLGSRPFEEDSHDPFACPISNVAQRAVIPCKGRRLNHEILVLGTC